MATIRNYNTPSLRITVAPSGGQLQLQRYAPKVYRAQRLLVANSRNCSPYTERNAPYWLLSAITTPQSP